MVFQRRLNFDDLDDPCWDRHKRAWQLRLQGKTYREVAVAMGLNGPDQSRHLVCQWALATNTPRPYRKHGWGKR